jgi:Right handed beta helix region
MNTHKDHARVFGVVVLLVMLLSLIFPTSTVFADDTTPPENSSEEVDAPEEEQVVDQEPAPEEEIDQEPAPEEEIDQEPPPEEAVDQEPPVEDSAQANESVIAQLPDNIELVLLDEQGETVSLASQEAAEIMAVPDPQFCPTGVLPGDATCSPIRTTIQAAVDDAKAAGVAGTVYVQSGTYNETVTIADFTNALTLQGVLGLAPYSALTDPADRPVINGRILLVDGPDNEPGIDSANRANITLADLIINDNNTSSGNNPAIFADRNTADLTFINLDLNAPGSGNSGLIVDNHSGNVYLTNVDASGTASNGADIDNTSGSGNVTVNGGTFDQNNTDGLHVRSDGVITLVEVTANQNRDDGADLDNSGNFLSTNNIEVVKSTFNSNTDDGLYAVSGGDITLVNVTAQNNNGDGVDLDFPNFSFNTHTATICGGLLSGQSGGSDYNVELTDDDIRLTNLTPNNWNPSGGWGAALCDYLDTDSDQVPDQWDTDDDNDGVLDTVDQCANTPSNETVDATGCPVQPPSTGGGGSSTGGGGTGSSRDTNSPIVPVTGLISEDLGCTPSDTTLQMEGFEVIIANLCGYETRLGEVTETELPADLPNSAQFVSGLNVSLTQDGNTVALLPTGASMTVLFTIPGGMEGDSFGILHWDGSKWVEENVIVENGSVKATTSNTGIFVLVAK